MEETEKLFEALMTENFSKLMSDTEQQIYGVLRTPKKINNKNTTPFKSLQIQDF